MSSGIILPGEENKPRPFPFQNHCSFCHAGAGKLEVLIVGPGVSICSSCVEHVLPVIAKARAERAAKKAAEEEIAQAGELDPQEVSSS